MKLFLPLRSPLQGGLKAVMPAVPVFLAHVISPAKTSWSYTRLQMCFTSRSDKVRRRSAAQISQRKIDLLHD